MKNYLSKIITSSILSFTAFYSGCSYSNYKPYTFLERNDLIQNSKRIKDYNTSSPKSITLLKVPLEGLIQ